MAIEIENIVANSIVIKARAGETIDNILRGYSRRKGFICKI